MTDNDQTVEVAWVTNTLVPGDTPTNADNVTWPQPLATGTECGDGWLQIDTYLVDAVPALTSDGQLTYGEDFDVVLEWRFEPLPACEEPEPTPTPTPEPTPTPSPEEPPGIPDLVCPEGTVPGWLNEEGLPTSCVSNDPQPTPEPSPSPTPQPPTVETQPPAPTTPDQPQLAETGFDPLLTVVAIAAILAGITLIRLRRTR